MRLCTELNNGSWSSSFSECFYSFALQLIYFNLLTTHVLVSFLVAAVGGVFFFFSF
eukprot:m.367248 g.367248  ORF g.367248 m.367248 type:complete len:56 (-) comp39676_c0_seq1:30-197(-)